MLQHTHSERILDYLRTHPEGVDDGVLSRDLGIVPRQTVNQACRKLASRGSLARQLGDSVGKIVNRLADGHVAAPPAMAAYASRAASSLEILQGRAAASGGRGRACAGPRGLRGSLQPAAGGSASLSGNPTALTSGSPGLGVFPSAHLCSFDRVANLTGRRRRAPHFQPPFSRWAACSMTLHPH